MRPIQTDNKQAEKVTICWPRRIPLGRAEFVTVLCFGSTSMPYKITEHNQYDHLDEEAYLTYRAALIISVGLDDNIVRGQ